MQESESPSLLDEQPGLERPSASCARTTVRGIHLPPALAELSDSACLVLIHGSPLGVSLDVPETQAYIGRGEQCDLCIDDLELSRIHCKVWRHGRRVWLLDLNSTNGSLVNGVPAVGATELHDGDHVMLGDTVLRMAREGTLERRYHRGMTDLASRDFMTGLFNRRTFQATIERQFAHARERKSQLALACIDLDRFKQINDEFGHSTGDDVIRASASIFKSVARACDTVCRVGGEEFAVLLPIMAADDALAFATACRMRIYRLSGLLEQRALNVSASIGIASLSDEMRSPQDLIDAADKELLRAKSLGRNRVCMAHHRDARMPG